MVMMILQEITLINETKQNDLMLLSNCLWQEKSIFIISIRNQELHNFNNISNDKFKIKKIIEWRQIYVRIAFKAARIYL